MKRKVKFAVAAVLMAFFAAMFAGEALAAKKPDWVGVKYTGWAVRKEKGKKDTAGDYVRFVLKFDITNNSKDGRIITAIYDRDVSWNGVLTLLDSIVYNNGKVEIFTDAIYGKTRSSSFNVKSAVKGKDPIKGEWYPGQTYKYETSVLLRGIMKPSHNGWRATNYSALHKSARFKLGKYSLDFQVSSKK